MLEITDIDLELHILFLAFRNTFLNPNHRETTQHLMSRLMTEYPHIFQTTIKISYTITSLKRDGLVAEELVFDREAYRKCLEKQQAEHPRMSRKRLEKECLRKVGYSGVLKLTEAGVIHYCERVLKHLDQTSTAKTNKAIINVCREYKTEAENVK